MDHLIYCWWGGGKSENASRQDQPLICNIYEWRSRKFRHHLRQIVMWGFSATVVRGAAGEFS